MHHRPLRTLAPLAVAALALAAGSCGASLAGTSRPANVGYGDANQGRTAIQHYGCGACHTIPGVRGADAKVGPPLTDFGDRSFIAGQLANTPDNLVRWIRDPQGVEPGTAMPDLAVTDKDAKDIVAYLEGL